MFLLRLSQTEASSPEQVIIQLKKESTLRAITGLNKALSLALQKVQGEHLSKWELRTG
jgi:hypothetical protein